MRGNLRGEMETTGADSQMLLILCPLPEDIESFVSRFFTPGGVVRATSPGWLRGWMQCHQNFLRELRTPELSQLMHVDEVRERERSWILPATAAHEQIVSGPAHALLPLNSLFAADHRLPLNYSEMRDIEREQQREIRCSLTLVKFAFVEGFIMWSGSVSVLLIVCTALLWVDLKQRCSSSSSGQQMDLMRSVIQSAQLWIS